MKTDGQLNNKMIMSMKHTGEERKGLFRGKREAVA